MKRFNITSKEVEVNKKVDDFIQDILRVYRKHDMAIGHEDSTKELIIYGLDKGFVKYLERAQDGTQESIVKNSHSNYKFKEKIKNPKVKYRFYKPEKDD